MLILGSFDFAGSLHKVFLVCCALLGVATLVLNAATLLTTVLGRLAILITLLATWHLVISLASQTFQVASSQLTAVCMLTPVMAFASNAKERTSALLLSNRVISLFTLVLIVSQYLPDSGLVVNHNFIPVFAVLLGLAIDRKSKWLFTLTAFLTVVTFLSYPASTYIASIPALLLVELLLWRRRLGKWLLAATVAGYLVLAGTPRPSIWLERLHELWPNLDNLETRAYILDQAWTEIRESFWFGHGFTSQLVAVANIRGRLTYVPFHSDIATLLTALGLVGLFLMLAFLVTLLTMITSRDFDGSHQRAGGYGIACLLVVGLVNPVITAGPLIMFVFAALIEGGRHRAESRDN